MASREPSFVVGLRKPRYIALAAVGVALATIAACAALQRGSPAPRPEAATAEPQRSLRVTATAYNSTPAQTLGDPNETAFGSRLEPGMRAIAVSRDLLAAGLTEGTKVRIEGLDGSYEVMDKMHSRWTKRIDIYMGNDVAAARRWGRRKVRITWEPAS